MMARVVLEVSRTLIHTSGNREEKQHGRRCLQFYALECSSPSPDEMNPQHNAHS